MSDKIITEFGQIKIEQQQATPAPIKVGLAQALKQITSQMDREEESFNVNQTRLDIICSQLLPEQWAILSDTQIQTIAVRSDDATNYLASIGK